MGVVALTTRYVTSGWRGFDGCINYLVPVKKQPPEVPAVTKFKNPLLIAYHAN